MNNKAIFYFFEKSVERGGGIHLTREQERICRRALWRFKQDSLELGDCYKKPSNAKISAYLECESLCDDYDVVQVCSSIIGYNCQAFSWAAVWATKTADRFGNITVYLRYDTAWHCRLIEICKVPYYCVK